MTRQLSSKSKRSRLEKVFREALESAIPDCDLTVSAWADTFRYIAPERSGRSGKWSTALVPYTKMIMDSASRADVHKIVFWKSSQIAGTEVLNNIIGYYMHLKPSPILYVCEDEKKAKAWSQESLATTIRDTPILNALVEDSRTRDSGNTIGAKKFPGGHLALAWASSPATLSSRPRRVVMFDEVDAFKPTTEGDPISLGEMRTETFEDYLIVLVSSPRDDETSKIKPAYEASYRGKYWVPCPHCGEFQTLEWQGPNGYNIRLDPGDTEAYYLCVSGCVIHHESKAEMLERGEWRFEGEFSGTIGFHIWRAYSPFASWTKILQDFKLKKRMFDETGDFQELQTFVNTSLAQTWTPYDRTIDITDLSKRCEIYPAEVPHGVLLLVAGVDTQDNRLEYEILGVGLGHETWSIAYGTIHGSPANPEVWQDLRDVLTREFQGPTGEIFTVKGACIDSRGHHTNEVYKFCRENKGRRFFAVMGANTPGRPAAPKKPTKLGRPATDVWTLGTEAIKDTLAARLRVKEEGPGFCHFPVIIDENGLPVYDENYFKQLRSERPVTVKGSGIRQWEKIKPSMRNEAWDLRVYATAAIAILNPDFRKLAKKRNVQPKEAPADPIVATETPNDEPHDPEPNETPKVPAKRPMKRRRRGFVNAWRF